VSYECESWTLKSTDEDRIKSFEMKAFRQILRVTWTDKRTNDWFLKKAGTEPFCYSQSRKESFLIMVMCCGKKKITWRTAEYFCALAVSVCCNCYAWDVILQNFVVPVTLYGHIKNAEQRTIIRQYGDWYIGRC